MKFKRFLVSILVIAITYFGSNAILNKLQDKKNISNYGLAAADENKEQKVPHEILMLLVGVDVNGDDEGNSDFTRTDTIMLCKINSETGKIDLLSIPRDSRIKVREEFTKANHAHAYGGIELTLQSLRKFLGLDIDYYAEINYDALVKIVDAMGGVEYTIPDGINIDHGDVHLRPGKTNMNGMDVLWYLRTRKIYNNGDLGRVSTQQEFMKNIVNEMVRKSKTMNLPTFVESYFKYVKTNVPLNIMLDFAQNISKFSSDKFSTYTVPGVANDIEGISYYIPDYEKTWELVDKVFGKYKLSGWRKEDSGYYEYDNFNYDNESNEGYDYKSNEDGSKNQDESQNQDEIKNQGQIQNKNVTEENSIIDTNPEEKKPKEDISKTEQNDEPADEVEESTDNVNNN
ncbi:LCP family protein [Anaerococcus sp. AGMB00486]|uniref:LCP family protein n=1 Tax=Anaerococcus faecalis TaxID=2742993 RepID=A0ABX2NAQ5_9FIRM|nr:LCP family protein [Anaerococcus faecalis]NVF11745.1 LCP family protein [Anaerococcus faecalis]